MIQKTRKYGLIGYPLTHTFSPKYFANKFSVEKIEDADYKAYEIEDLSDLFILFENGLSGLNVTIPYKEKVIPLLDKLDKTSEAIGAVNTIKNENGILTGYNTDVVGFVDNIEPFLVDVSDTNCLILGSGGASKAVSYGMRSLGYKCSIVSRTRGDYTYSDLEKNIMDNHKVVVNTTPLGMSPYADACPEVPYRFISENHLVYDLIYNPEKTLFLKKAEQYGATIINGFRMLELQAEASWKIWNS